jgi:outer membrane protein assembly factor BamB
MRPPMRNALLACYLASALAGAGCGTTRDGGSSAGQDEFGVTACDGSPLGHATAALRPATLPPAVYVGTVGSIGGQQNGLFAFDAATGALRWCDRFALTQTYTCPPGARCPPAPIAEVGMPLIAGSVAYVCVSGGPAGATYAFDAADGALRWSRATGCQMVSEPFDDNARPILTDGVLYSGTYGLAPSDGSVRWHLPQAVTQSTIGAVADGVVYVYSEDTLAAVRLADDTVAWTARLDAPIGDLPVPVGGHIYVGDIGGDSPPAITPGLPDVYALDARTGAVLWRAPTGIVSGSSALASVGFVYIGAANALDALDPATGAIRWQVQVAPNSAVQSTPVLMSGLVYFVADGAYAVDAVTGAVRWHAALGWDQSTSFSGPALRDDMLYLGSMDGSGRGTLYALDAATGTVRWQHSGFNQLIPPAV